MICKTITKTITAITNYFTDRPEPEEIFLPLAKLPKEPKVEKPILSQYFKSQLVEDRAKYLNLQVYEIMWEMIAWIVEELKLTPCVTETVTMPDEDKLLGRKSTSHQEGRAFDLRTKDWNEEQIKRFQDHFNQKYLDLGAVGRESGERKLIKHHNSGHGDHFHIQFNRDFSTQIKEGKLA